MTQHPFDDALAAYALDALESSEAARLEGHLATCAACRAEVAILRDASALLATTAVRVQPSAGMRARVLAKAVATRGTAAPAATRMTPWTPWLLAAASLVAAPADEKAFIRYLLDRPLDQRSAIAHQRSDGLSGLSLRCTMRTEDGAGQARGTLKKRRNNGPGVRMWR